MSMPIDEILRTIRTDFYSRLDEHSSPFIRGKYDIKILFEQAVDTGIQAYMDFLTAKWEKEKYINE